MKLLKQLIKDNEGATMIEYAILASLIAVVAIGAITTVGTNISSTFNTIGSQISAG